MSNVKNITQNYLPIIGIEVHVELNTKSKMFCGCSAHHFNVPPNTHTCPVCLGLPGALPVPNKQAIEWCLMIGLALNCQINDYSKFDRKNYFYPDLSKGYQISQYDMPFCYKGNLKFRIQNSELAKVRITRVHMEEDTGKLVHDKTNATLIDFNRSGVPLVEIVTEPDINSTDEAVIYLKKIQQIIRYLGVSDCDMEKGSMRCEVNISLHNVKSQMSKVKTTNQNLKLPNYKVEVKNINSFKFVKKAIEYEIKRQTELLSKGEIPIQETRGFSETKAKTYSQRSKEEAHDYRYFPEPDIPPFTNLKSQMSLRLVRQSSPQIRSGQANVKAKIPELPDKKYDRFIKQYSLPENYVQILTENRELADYFEQAVKQDNTLTKKIADLIVNKKIDVHKVKAEEIVSKFKQQVTQKVSDTAVIGELITKILRLNPKAIADFKNGKETVIGFLVGQVMRETKGKADAQIVKKLLIKKLT